MYSFRNDYSEGALPQVLDALVRTNLESTCGYGRDAYCQQAEQTILTRFACPDAQVHFLVGGTQTNFTAITAFLRPWEAVIAAKTAHIAVHETGSVEARGHKVYCVEAPDGKLTPELIHQAVKDHQGGEPEHMVLPRLVYVSQATELGTVYTRQELTAISETCRQQNLLLFVDGARLAAGLAASDLEPEELPKLCDAFYLGGTKTGLLFGEALVIVNPQLQPFFRHVMKQSGAILAKGRLLGIQFQALLENDLWLAVGQRENDMAAKLAQGFVQAGYQLYVNSPTNQIFVILPIQKAQALQADFSFEYSAPFDSQHNVYRFVTSWATQAHWITALLQAL